MQCCHCIIISLLSDKPIRLWLRNYAEHIKFNSIISFSLYTVYMSIQYMAVQIEFRSLYATEPLKIESTRELCLRRTLRRALSLLRSRLGARCSLAAFSWQARPSQDTTICIKTTTINLFLYPFIGFLFLYLAIVVSLFKIIQNINLFISLSISP